MFEKSQAKAEFFGSIMGRGIMMVALSLIKYRSSMMIMIAMIIIVVTLSIISYRHVFDHQRDCNDIGFDDNLDCFHLVL